MADRTHRLLRLLSALQARAHWSGPELADRLGVTVRTVRRDIDELRTLGYPVDSEPGIAGGYRLAPGATLPPLLLDDDEAVAVAVCLRAGAAGSVRGVAHEAVAALAKLEGVLPTHLRHQVSALALATETLTTDDAGVDADLLVFLALAARELLVVELDYRDARGNESHRRIEPFRVVQANRRWYLLARDQRHDDWRIFRLDRIVARHTSGHRFRRVDPPADAAAFVAHAITTAPYPYRAEILLRASVEEASARIGPTVGTLEAVDAGTTRLVLGADDLRYIALRLAALDVDFTIESPPELAAVVVELGARLISHQRQPVS
jgi:predicted DNA-binding transcriptional regulator YafY